MMKKILITGGNGQLGSSLKEREDKFTNAACMFTDIDALDLLDKQAVQDFFDARKPDIVINCAAYTAVDKAEVDTDNAKMLNADLPGFLGELCNQHNAKMVHISTDYVFSGEVNRPYTETDAANPVTEYGKTKFQGEQHLHKQLPDALILRTSWLYSPYGGNFLKTMLRLGKEKDKINVVYDQVGSPTYAGHLADGIIHVINRWHETKNWESGVFHFSNQGVCSWYDFAWQIMQHANLKCHVQPVTTDQFPTPAKRPPYSVMSKAAFENTFNYAIPHWQEGVAGCLKRM
ncbi:MAG: dTDP-4-dehydrorhamnose reductase [Bacteroidota bacterium]|nr:dTDP-4-dehydrorhamnose reductase [Bacteroidota bacterium]